MKRIIYAVQWFWMALTRPKVFKFEYFKLVEGIMKFLEASAKAQVPMGCELRFTKLAEILYEDGKDRPFLHLWCGVNETDNPVKRVMELAEENKKLRERISQLTSNPQPTQ